MGEAHTKKSLLARYRCVRYLFHLMVGVMDPSRQAKNRVVDQVVLDALAAPLSEAEVALRRERLESVLGDLIEASVQVCSADELAGFDGSVGLDATVVPLFSRGPSARAGTSASDPDGGWYVREGDHRDVGGPKSKKLRRLLWAKEATIVTMGRPPAAVPEHPNLVLGARLGPPGEDPGGTGVRLLLMVAKLPQDRRLPGPRGHRRNVPGGRAGPTTAHEYHRVRTTPSSGRLNRTATRHRS